MNILWRIIFFSGINLSMPKKILLLDDDATLNSMVTQFLQGKGYQVDNFTQTYPALEKLSENTYDLIIFDVMLDGLDGINLCLKLRKDSIDTPILLITALQSKSDLVKGFKAGADDFLNKPFDWDEFLLRIEALLKRYSPEEETNDILLVKVGDLTIDRDSHQILFLGNELHLTSIEFKLFETFLTNPNKTFSADYLIDTCWDLDEIPSGSTLRTHIKKLRKKLQKVGANHDLIETVYGVGYKLNPDKATSNRELKIQRKQIANEIDKLFGQFKDSLIDNLKTLKQYAEGENVVTHQQAIKLSHDLAGTLGNFSFLKESSTLCSQIEQKLKQDSDKFNIIEEINQVYSQVTSCKSN